MTKVSDIRRREAMIQVGRFDNYPGFPSEAQVYALEELIKAFQSAAEIAGSARLVGDRLIRTMKFAPRPADVYEAAQAIEESLRQPKEFDPTVKCELCQDTRFVRAEDINGYSVVKRC